MAVFESLSSRLQGTFDSLRGKGRLTEEDIDNAMREVRMALLEADVNFKVVKEFVSRTRERCLTSEVLDSLTPAQNVVRIVLDELTELLGSTESKLVLTSRIPNVIMLVGLQGSGKTTAAAKLALLLKNQGHAPLLAACDVYRPAAADQLETLGGEIGVKVFREDSADPVQIAQDAVRAAVDDMKDIVIVDTAGRLQIDEQMMQEAANIKAAVKPDQILMVVDSMTGQDIVNVVSAFAERVDFDGVIMTKLDGDARGGGALSVRSVTGKPIKFISTGEKPGDFEVFHPDRMARRILGMGDMVSVIEKVSAQADEEQAAAAERMLRKGMTYDDFLAQLKQIEKLGGFTSIISSLPGGDKLLDRAGGSIDPSISKKTEAIIMSMTKDERSTAKPLNGSRRARIARGAGVEVYDVNNLVKQFDQMNRMMAKLRSQANGTGGSGKGKKGKHGKKAGKGMRTPSLSGLSGMGMGGMNPRDVAELQRAMRDMMKNQ
jgi:signal recognition particle subunit SRP54